MASQIAFVEGIPEDIPALFPLHCRTGILVLDDFMRNCSEDEHILDPGSIYKCLIIVMSLAPI